jgi:hypothetical protein
VGHAREHCLTISSDWWTGNLLSNRNIAIDRYFDGTIDDVLDVLPPPIHAFLAELKEKTKDLIHEISHVVQQFVNDVLLLPPFVDRYILLLLLL